MSREDVRGKVVVVTGASSGNGKASRALWPTRAGISRYPDQSHTNCTFRVMRGMPRGVYDGALSVFEGWGVRMEKATRIRETEAKIPDPAPTVMSRRRCFWIVTRTVRGRQQIMPTRLPGHRLAVAVFSFEEEALMFLKLSSGRHGGGAGGRWRIQKTDPGQLASVLLDRGGRVGWVTLDPLTVAGAEPMNVLASMWCADFLDFLLENRSGGQLDASWAGT